MFGHFYEILILTCFLDILICFYPIYLVKSNFVYFHPFHQFFCVQTFYSFLSFLLKIILFYPCPSHPFHALWCNFHAFMPFIHLCPIPYPFYPILSIFEQFRTLGSPLWGGKVLKNDTLQLILSDCCTTISPSDPCKPRVRSLGSDNTDQLAEFNFLER